MEITLNLFLLVFILGVSAVLTQWFSNFMYMRCPECGTLNARRRTHCRVCSHLLRRLTL